MNARYSIGLLSSALQGVMINRGNEAEFSRILLDSRSISFPEESLFIAIKGEHHDGHHYVQAAYDKGVRQFVVEREIDCTTLAEANILQVENAIAALQKLASFHRSKFKLPVIGITGSNGKTIVKEWLNVLLADEYQIVRSPKSFNSQIGVPLSVWNIQSQHTLGIFEAGISLPGEMKSLEKVIRPTLGIFVNVGGAHRENFESLQQLANEKANLFEGSNHVVYSVDYPEIHAALKGKASTTFSFLHNADLAVVNKTIQSKETLLECSWKGQLTSYVVPFTDQASLENVLCCIATLLHLGYAETEVASRLSRLMPIAMRLEVLSGENDTVIINDTYSSDIHSLEIALDFMVQQGSKRKRAVILSDLLQSGIEESELYKRINELLIDKGVERMVGIGTAISIHADLFKMEAEFYLSTSSFLKSHRSDRFYRHTILVKGAREFKFEAITQQLQEQTHETILEIDLNAMAHNLHYFRSKLRPGVKLMAMVKAFGYGSGAHEVASLLEFHKADYLAVAYTDEGVLLRQSGISLPIMVMNPGKGSFNALIQHHLEPEIFSIKTFEEFILATRDFAGQKVPAIHIKLDTGMHRLGFELSQIENLGRMLKALPGLEVASVFTHLAAADNPEHDEFTRNQLDLFHEMADQLEALCGKTFLRHAANTGGIERFDSAQMDMVRLGIGLYGVASHAPDQTHLRTVSTLKTQISQIKTILKGDSIGYNRNFFAKTDMAIATIPVGYADGLRRNLSNGVGEVVISGRKCPIVGNVCMDMTMVDITGMSASEGDTVVVFGQEMPVQEVAERAGTIAYEVLSTVPQRVKRIYLQE